MRRFAQLHAELDAVLDAGNATEARQAALQRYLADADPADAAWAVYLLAGGRLPPTVPAAVLRSAARRLADIPEWLFDTCCQAVGDLAETIALVLPPPGRPSTLGLAGWITERLLPLRGVASADQAAVLAGWWDELTADERWLLGKLIGGGIRLGLSRLQLQQALAAHAGLNPKVVAQRWIAWADKPHKPSADRLRALMAPIDAAGSGAELAAGQPFPFLPAQALDPSLADQGPALGPLSRWLVEWQYDGLRAQVVRSAAGVWVWSRGDELINERVPEVLAWAQALPAGTVLDGVLLVWQGERPAASGLWQQRLDRPPASRALQARAPLRFIAFDLLAWQGQDQRSQPLARRRQQLQLLLATQPGHLSAPIEADTWPSLALRRQECRARGATGLMFKHLGSAYGPACNPSDGPWWAWKIAAHTVAAVLVYAQAGSGRGAGAYTDFSFAVWSRPPSGADEAAAVVAAIEQGLPARRGTLQLLVIAKAGSGLSDEDMRQVDQAIRGHTLAKFGPVRSVRPTLVIELAFDGIATSARHKCGVLLRLPRPLRIRHDLPLHQADALASLLCLLQPAVIVDNSTGIHAP